MACCSHSMVPCVRKEPTIAKGRSCRPFEKRSADPDIDLHANITAQMVANADAVIGYKTYPHIDLYETGQTAARMLTRMLQAEIRPVTVMQKIPLIIPAENMHTTNGPMGDIFSRGRGDTRRASGYSLRFSVWSSTVARDIDEMGGATVVVVDRDTLIGRRCAVQMAKKFWELKDEFRKIWSLCAVEEDLIQRGTAQADVLGGHPGGVQLAHRARAG